MKSVNAFTRPQLNLDTSCQARMNALPSTFPPASRSAEVVSIREMGCAVINLRLRQPPDEAMAYQEGQFLSVILPDGDARSYSMAARKSDEGVIDLHIRLHGDGKFSKILTNQLKAGDSLQLVGPFGDCYLRPRFSADSPVIMLATGTGIAPLKAMIEKWLETAAEGPLSLYWGGMTTDDLYLMDHFSALAERVKAFRFIPVLATGDETWRGRRGFVQDIAAIDYPDMSGSHVYACGSPAMVNGARTMLPEICRLSADCFFSDSFEVSSAVSSPSGDTGQVVEVLVHREGLASPMEQVLMREDGTLMEGLRAAGVVTAVCAGKASCGTCRVTVAKEWTDRLPQSHRVEKRLLGTLNDVTADDRLSCQIALNRGLSGLEITIPKTTW